MRTLLVLLFALLIAPVQAASISSKETLATIKATLNSSDRLPLPIERIRQPLKAYYITNKGGIYWVGTDRMSKFIARLQNAELDGLNPADYPIQSLIDMRDQITDASTATRAELYFDAFFAAYAADLRIGRVAPQKVDPSLYRSQKTIDMLRVLTDMAKQPDPNQTLAQYEPRNPHYLALKKMLALYLAAAEEGGWPRIADGPVVKPGGSDPRIPKIRALLSYIGDYNGPPNSSPVYDQALATAVQGFQSRHGLEAKGLLGKQTIIAMNVTPAERAQQIMLNMERWRWMPDNLGAEHITVNIAAYELQEVENDQIVNTMGVVTGAVATQTPEFSDDMEYVEFNPYWTVPYSIATREMLPKLRDDPNAYAADFDVFMNGQQVSWDGIDWRSYGAGAFPFTFRQRPGPKNALGRVKFMFPNPYNIYLHDTPAREKFANTTRAFSHGCIRLSQPLELAHRLVDHIPGWSPEQVDAVLASGQNTKVVLPRKIPVHLIYATAFKGQNGIEFRNDVYGRDRKLLAALQGRSAS